MDSSTTPPPTRRAGRSGKAKNFDTARALLLKLGNEGVVLNSDGSIRRSRFELILRDWLNSNNFHKQKAAMEMAFGKVPERLAEEDRLAQQWEQGQYSLPIRCIAPTFLDVYDDLMEHGHTEYVLYGGRGSTKSSFVSLAIIALIKNNPDMHVLVLRKVKDTLRDSVFAQLQWAIGELELEAEFKSTTSPLEITYVPTGQKIFFRGSDEPGKIKSIKTIFGYIGMLWFEELDQFAGEESVRKIEQSAIRGGDIAYIFKTFNPPLTSNNWANKYIKIPKATQYQHKSTYLDLGARIRWLGRAFVEEAEHLKEVSPAAYAHEYLGEVTGTGGLVFPNVELRTITDEEIKTFERPYFGQDWGYALDPLHWVKLNYNAGQEIIYIYDEYRARGMRNRDLYEVLVNEKGMTPADLLIADSAEPKSIADMQGYGLMVRGTEKGPDSVRYSLRWLQNRVKIIIDPVRCPFTAEEFLNYEYKQTRDGEWMSEYPDRDNHAIDAVRYALNLVWRKRGN